MVKVLIYSSKEIYDNASYEGRAEAHIIAYRRNHLYYEITKNRTTYPMGSYMTYKSMQTAIQLSEEKEWLKECTRLLESVSN